ncbi:uncharacterized protein LOC127846099 [Dreissena polymorpha]|uniref:Uncharacterized protein n=1 Tax=Dreissena polymorpha TaxID=45954 RepID=A0A9D4MMX1_DREPO|nr:uncharacterized protein LOC127846099 [Dreissena polymorpha]KAH3878426.1 hypothetical protein DPMN_002319 [Dreissena polymorpha]
MNGRIILGIASFLYCIAGVVSYHPFFFPRYQPDNYVSVHKSPTSRNPFEFKRRWPSGFDRLSMGFIKRDKNENTRNNDETMRNNDETSSLDVYDKGMYDKLLDDLYTRKAHENPPQLSKRYFDRLSSGFIRKKRSAVPNSRSYVGNSIQKSQLNVQKNVDTTNPMEHPDSVGKRDYDRHVTEQEQGREDAVSGKRGFDRLNAGFVKRPFDRLNSGFVKRPFEPIKL